MAWRFALVIDPAASDDEGVDYRDTLHEIDPHGPALGVGELSAQRGDGVFESLGVVDGHPQEVGPHLARLAHSAALCDLPAPNLAQWRVAIERVAREAGAGENVMKLLLSRGVEHGPAPTAWITLADAPDNTSGRTTGVAVATLDRGYALDVPARAPWLLLGAKTLSYAVNMAAIREAKRRGADDAVFVTSDGYLLEAPTASVVLRVGDRFVTPSRRPASCTGRRSSVCSRTSRVAASPRRTRRCRRKTSPQRMPPGCCRACGSRPRSDPSTGSRCRWTAPSPMN